VLTSFGDLELCVAKVNPPRLRVSAVNSTYNPGMAINEITEAIIGASIEVHRELVGPGLLESAYRQCLCHELQLRGAPFVCERPLPVVYKGLRLDCGFRVDLIVADAVVVELKTVDHLAPVHDAQLLTYLRLGGWKVGLLINFNVALLRNGIHRRVEE
jgi:GxxExxY protein